jgi:apolipoprotein D and lipocalin family protein
LSILLNANDLTTVNEVDLLRYKGVWHEIAKLPNRFQKKCAKNVTATYRLREEGDISVINRCVEKDGKINTVEGIAKVVDRATNAKLEVSFVRFLWSNWFYGNYWIIGLADDYSWAVVGEPTRKYGWILAREKQLEEPVMQEIFSLLKHRGYDSKEFVMTIQD